MRHRRSVGARRYRATFQRHAGAVDDHGNPTYSTTNNWDAIVENWPCELIAASGGERLRGMQVSDQTTFVLFGEYHGADTVRATDRAIVDGRKLHVISARDETGRQRELRIECGEES